MWCNVRCINITNYLHIFSRFSHLMSSKNSQICVVQKRQTGADGILLVHMKCGARKCRKMTPAVQIPLEKFYVLVSEIWSVEFDTNPVDDLRHCKCKQIAFFSSTTSLVVFTRKLTFRCWSFVPFRPLRDVTFKMPNWRLKCVDC